jgi:hypothetical protein
MVNCELPVTSLLLASADCLLLAASCLLRLKGVEFAGRLARTAVYDKMPPPTGKERSSNFKN